MNRKIVAAILTLLILAFLIAFHQYYYHQTWFQVDDIHHETFVVGFICLALGIAVSEELR